MTDQSTQPDNKNARETGKTGGGILQVPAAFLRRFSRQPKDDPSSDPKPENRMFSSQVWLATWQSQNGETDTTPIQICGVWRMADLEKQALNALDRQRGINNVQIVRLSRYLNQTPDRAETLQYITSLSHPGNLFEEGSD